MYRDEVYYRLSNDFIDPKSNKSIGYVDTISTSMDPYTEFSADITITDRKFYDQIVNIYKGGSISESVTPKKYQIKKVVVNPEKEATTVIFKDGTVEVVKKSPEDPEADIFSVVAYAVAKRVYGSNSAFKREVVNKVEVMKFKEKKYDASIESLSKAVDSLAKTLKGVKK
ncbi:MAG: hypothetical protein K6G85_06335 [Eubacterium sp.]|nr:hypothetical protein [Eubacterium sp.]